MVSRPEPSSADSMSAQVSAAASERRSSASRIVRQSASSMRPRAVGGVLAAIAARAISVSGLAWRCAPPATSRLSPATVRRTPSLLVGSGSPAAPCAAAIAVIAVPRVEAPAPAAARSVRYAAMVSAPGRQRLVPRPRAQDSQARHATW